MNHQDDERQSDGSPPSPRFRCNAVVACEVALLWLSVGMISKTPKTSKTAYSAQRSRLHFPLVRGPESPRNPRLISQDHGTGAKRLGFCWPAATSIGQRPPGQIGHGRPKMSRARRFLAAHRIASHRPSTSLYGALAMVSRRPPSLQSRSYLYRSRRPVTEEQNLHAPTELRPRRQASGKCPDSQRSTWTMYRCNAGLGVSRHPPVIRFRQDFKGLRRGNTNATCRLACWHGPVLFLSGSFRSLASLVVSCPSCPCSASLYPRPSHSISDYFIFYCPPPGWPSNSPETPSSTLSSPAHSP